MAAPLFQVFTGATRQLGPTRHLTGLTLDGAADLIAMLQAVGADAPAVVAGVLYREGERIMAESKAEVPVETGALKGTGHVQVPETRGDLVSVTLGYGGPAAPYAIIVHEDLMARHLNGKAKYLEDPMLRAAGTMEARLAAELGRLP